MRLSLLLIVLVAGIRSQSGKGAEGDGGGVSTGSTGSKAKTPALRIDWNGRVRLAGQERVIGWGLDRMAPALRISDGDRAIPARVRPTWLAWRKKYGKGRSYHNDTEVEMRARIFEQAEKMVEENRIAFEQGEVSYTIGINQFADYTEEESSRMRMSKDAMEARKKYMSGINATESTSFTRVKRSIPFRFDWREHGVISPAKDQAECGSCYAFGVIAAFEAFHYQKTGERRAFSEQHVVDCSYRTQGGMNNGCGGGHELVVMDFLIKNGAFPEEEYPYTSGKSRSHSRCAKLSSKFAKLEAYSEIRPGNENAMVEALSNYGPLIISMSGYDREFQMYRGGVYDNPSCSEHVDHVLLAIGFGSENGKDYFLVKNSWGTKWGENGFGKIRRGVNRCGIASDSSWYLLPSKPKN